MYVIACKGIPFIKKKKIFFITKSTDRKKFYAPCLLKGMGQESQPINGYS